MLDTADTFHIPTGDTVELFWRDNLYDNVRVKVMARYAVCGLCAFWKLQGEFESAEKHKLRGAPPKRVVPDTDIDIIAELRERPGSEWWEHPEIGRLIEREALNPKYTGELIKSLSYHIDNIESIIPGYPLYLPDERLVGTPDALIVCDSILPVEIKKSSFMGKTGKLDEYQTRGYMLLLDADLGVVWYPVENKAFLLPRDEDIDREILEIRDDILRMKEERFDDTKKWPRYISDNPPCRNCDYRDKCEHPSNTELYTGHDH